MYLVQRSKRYRQYALLLFLRPKLTITAMTNQTRSRCLGHLCAVLCSIAIIWLSRHCEFRSTVLQPYIHAHSSVNKKLSKE